MMPLACSITGMHSSLPAAERARTAASGPALAGEDRSRRRASALARQEARASVSTCVLYCHSSPLRVQEAAAYAHAAASRPASSAAGWAAPGSGVIPAASGS